ncbi:MAG TPA: S41 family peptidase, partial [Gemmatimonadales bacterium]|nr:S41 family peptidase [Gemmatimonadales bacterium]
MRAPASRAWLLLALATPAPAAAQAAHEELQNFSAALNHIRGHHVDSVSYRGLVQAAIEGMLRGLDPHSWYASRADYERLSAVERGKLATPGIDFELVDGVPTVLSVAAGGPAAKAGIVAGDRLRRVDGIPATGFGGKSLAIRLAGEKGSKVELVFERGPRLEPDTFAVRVTRDFVRPRSVSLARMLDSATGYLRLETFGPDAAKEVRDAIGKLRRARRLVLDLRGNPGGIVDEAVDLAAEFLPSKTLVSSTRGRRRAANGEYRTERDGAHRELPLVVLIDEGSASASEALAASLQDHDRALVIGRRSFGKALMQTAFFVADYGVVMLTVGHVVAPSGRVIQRRYRGLAIEQYYSFAGNVHEGEDTLAAYHTAGGRVVRGGGGIAPDVPVARRPAPPAWWSVAVDSGFVQAVADSVAYTLGADPASRARWIASPDEWR